MLRDPKVGDAAELSFRVEANHCIELDEGVPAVLSTPSLIWFLEQAARKMLATIEEKGEGSVGVQVDVKHLAATPLGKHVTCSARVVHRDGNNVSFQVQAHDEQELIARGVHKRHLIQLDRFAKSVQKKM